MATTRNRVVGWLVAGVATAVVALAIVASSIGPGPLRATGSTPGDGARLQTAPDDIAISFEGLRDPIVFHLVVAADDGRQLPAQATARLDGDRLVLPTVFDRPGGFVAAYHVALADGQQVSGMVRFTVLAPGDQTPAAAGAQPSTSDAAGHEHGGSDPLSRVLLIVDFLLILGVVVVLARRPRSRRGRDDTDPAEPTEPTEPTDSGRDGGVEGGVDLESQPELASVRSDRGAA